MEDPSVAPAYRQCSAQIRSNTYILEYIRFFSIISAIYNLTECSQLWLPLLTIYLLYNSCTLQMLADILLIQQFWNYKFSCFLFQIPNREPILLHGYFFLTQTLSLRALNVEYACIKQRVIKVYTFRRGGQGPSIKDVSSNFSFLTPPTYPCLLFLLNNPIQ